VKLGIVKLGIVKLGIVIPLGSVTPLGSVMPLGRLTVGSCVGMLVGIPVGRDGGVNVTLGTGEVRTGLRLKQTFHDPFSFRTGTSEAWLALAVVVTVTCTVACVASVVFV
jgi:hypothetical protein